MARVGVTGQSGFVGGVICAILKRLGHTPVNIYLDQQRKYRLGDEVDPQELAEFDFLIHCAHDFTLRDRKICEVNFLGSIPLLLSAHNRKIPILFISSLAAHSKTKSWYGFTKLCLENSVKRLEGYSVRLGVLPLELRGNRFANLAKKCGAKQLIFCPGNKNTFFYLTNLDCLEKFIVSFLSDRLRSDKIYKISSENPLTYKDLFLKENIIYVNISILQFLVKVFEIFAAKSFGSDSLKSLLCQITSEEFSSLESV